MAQAPQQLVRVANRVFHATRGKLGIGGVIGLVIAAALYIAVLQPLAESQLGISLPTITETRDTSVEQRTDRGASQEPSPDESPSRSDQVDPKQLGSFLTEVGRGTYRTPAGLRYTRGSQQGHRLDHVMYHTHDVPDRVGQHGVFNSDDPETVLRLVDEAYLQAKSGMKTEQQRNGSRIVYTINLGRQIGYIGGQSGNRRDRPPANYLKLVIEGDRVITAFPFRP